MVAPFWVSGLLLASVLGIVLAVWFGILQISRRLTRATPAAHTGTASLLVGITLLLWAAAAFTLGIQGFFRPDPAVRIPHLAYTMIAPVVGLGSIALFRPLRTIVAATPIPWMTGVQIYRTFGIIFVILYLRQQLPGVFALPAGIGDALIGVTAPIVALLYSRGYRQARWLAILWNIAGIADLALAVTLGVLSTPGPLHRLALDTPNELITSFPLVLIPSFVVPLSFLLHMLSLQRLLGTPGQPIQSVASMVS